MMRKTGLIAALGIMVSFSSLAFSAPRDAEPTDATQMLSRYAKDLPAPRLPALSQETDSPFALSLSRELPGKKTGDIEEFWTCNIASNTFERTKAALSVIGKHCYVYIETGKEIPSARLDEITTEFDAHIYPTVTKYFGQEWNPGVDNDPRVTLLLMDIKDGYKPKGVYTAGYFNPGDEYPEGQLPAESHLKSNQREMLYLDIDPADINSRFFMSVVAHEFQHMIHFHQDSKEYTWVNEGCSQMATYFCGYGHPSQIKAFSQAPDNSLVAWNRYNLLANYGQTYLWNSFLASKHLKTDQQRQDFFTSLVKDTEKGTKSYDGLLRKLGTDFTTTHREFILTSYLNDPKLEKGRFSLGTGLEEIHPAPSALVQALPGTLMGDVFLWAADAIKVDLAVAKKVLRIDFAGDLTSSNNEFEVVMAFIDNSGDKRVRTSTMDNIKPTTVWPAIQPVMLPSDPDMPPPPLIRTQMGSSIIEVPEGFDSMFIYVIAKSSIGDPDEFLGWDPKMRYRLDIKDSGESPRPARDVAAPADLASLIREYADLVGAVAAISPEERIERLDQVRREIGSIVRSRLEAGSTDELEKEVGLLLAQHQDSPAMARIFRDIRSQAAFQELHSSASQ